jgi:hypothetical protein
MILPFLHECVVFAENDIFFRFCTRHLSCPAEVAYCFVLISFWFAFAMAGSSLIPASYLLRPGCQEVRRRYRVGSKQDRRSAKVKQKETRPKAGK